MDKGEGPIPNQLARAFYRIFVAAILLLVGAGIPYAIAQAVFGSALISLLVLGAAIYVVVKHTRISTWRKKREKRAETDNSQDGFALVPIIIVVAALLIIGGGGSAVYQIQKSNEEEKSVLKQELQALQEQDEVESGQEPTDEEKQEDEPSPTPSPTPESHPEVKAATTSKPATNSSTINEPDVPLIVEQEFEKVYGRKPTLSESNNWKNKFRANDWSRSQLHDAIIVSKATGSVASIQQVVLPTAKTSATNPVSISSTKPAPTAQSTVNLYAEQQKAEQERISRVRDQLLVVIADTDRKMTAILLQIGEI